MISKMFKSSVIALFALSVSTVAVADPFKNDPNENAADGQQRQINNCVRVIDKQDTNGQTGANTGNEKDPMQLNTAVTNCDHFWFFSIGTNGGPPE